MLERLKNQSFGKLAVMAWNVLRMALFRLGHPGCRVSLRQNLHPSTELIAEGGGRLVLGKSVLTRRNVSFKASGGEIAIGTSFFNQNCTVTALERVTIGDNCQFGPNVVIVDHDHDFALPGEARGTHYKTAPVEIEDNVWVGANVTILRGTRIGGGSVIGAGSVVKGEIPAGTVVRNVGALSQEPIRYEI